MKTLKQFQEATGYLKVKSPDEQKFVDKHEVETMDDQNGNGDEVFKASKVKKVARKAERKGYEPGEDEQVYEEVEELDELSQDKLMSYRKAARKQGSGPDTGPRKAGYNLAGRKVNPGLSAVMGKAPRVAATEEVQIDELSTRTLQSYRKKARAQGNAIVDKMKMGGGDWSKDQKDTKTLRKRAAGAQMSGKTLRKRGESLKTEEVEQVDEISKATMGRYINRAKDQIDTVSYRQGHRDSRGAGGDPISRKNERKLSKRHGGIELAVKKMTKEEADYLVNRYAEFKENISGLTPRLQEAMHYVLDRLNEENQDKFIAACQTEEGLEKMAAFAIENRGE